MGRISAPSPGSSPASSPDAKPKPCPSPDPSSRHDMQHNYRRQITLQTRSLGHLTQDQVKPKPAYQDSIEAYVSIADVRVIGAAVRAIGSDLAAHSARTVALCDGDAQNDSPNDGDGSRGIDGTGRSGADGASRNDRLLGRLDSMEMAEEAGQFTEEDLASLAPCEWQGRLNPSTAREVLQAVRGEAAASAADAERTDTDDGSMLFPPEPDHEEDEYDGIIADGMDSTLIEEEEEEGCDPVGDDVDNTAHRPPLEDLKEAGAVTVATARAQALEGDEPAPALSVTVSRSIVPNHHLHLHFPPACM